MTEIPIEGEPITFHVNKVTYLNEQAKNLAGDDRADRSWDNVLNGMIEFEWNGGTYQGLADSVQYDWPCGIKVVNFVRKL